MIADALRQVRFHPGRFVATLLAIALSVGFMSAVSTFMATQSAALGQMSALPISKADIAVEGNDVTTDPATFQRALSGVPGVEAVEKSRPSMAPLNHGGTDVMTTLHVLPSERFRWARLETGAWPVGSDQVAISRQIADTLKVTVGDQVQGGGEVNLTVAGITDDAPTIFVQTAYIAPDSQFVRGDDNPNGDWLIALKPGTDAAATVQAVDAAVASYRGQVRYDGNEEIQPIVVRTGADARHAAATGLTGDFDVMKNMLLGFTAVAAVVGMIIIANTFSILLAQRRRQIGLLRAVGASGGQVRGRFLAEAVVLGLIGSLLGIGLGIGAAALGSALTKSLWFGLILPWGDLAVEIAVGVVLTVLAAMLPALRATRVAPLEALQPVATVEQARRASRWRAVVTGLIVAAGAGLAVWSLRVPVDPEHPATVGPLVLAMGGALLIAIGVLAAAPLYVPVLLRAFGRLVGLFGPTPRLAGENSVRNPTRAAATATALMLATGLIVTLQIGVATAQNTMTAAIERRMPIDLAAGTIASGSTTAPTGLPADVVAKLTALPNVAHTATLSGGEVALVGEEGTINAVGVTPDLAQIASVLPTSVADGTILIGQSTYPPRKTGETLTVTAADGSKLPLTVKSASWVSFGQGVVSQTTLAKLVKNPKPQAVLLKLADRRQVATTMSELQRLSGGAGDQQPVFTTAGSALGSAMIHEVLSTLLMITSALLGVAVVIALIGVGNTLGLSVIERTRESALLRALGMQRGSLRLMLLVEALLLGGVGVLIGVAAGVFFGWLGMSALLREVSIDAPLTLSVDWVQTLGMVAIAIAAAALASVLPGRRAAKASPVEALAAD